MDPDKVKRIFASWAAVWKASAERWRAFYMVAHDNVAIVEAERDALLEEARFIPCSERMPEEMGTYLVATKDRIVFTASWMDGEKRWVKEPDFVGWDIVCWRSWPKFV